MTPDPFLRRCKPCHKIEPLFQSLAKEYPENLFVSVDVDDHDDIACSYKAMKIPMFVLFKDGVMTERLVGSDEDQLKEFVAK